MWSRVFFPDLWVNVSLKSRVKTLGTGIFIAGFEQVVVEYARPQKLPNTIWNLFEIVYDLLIYVLYHISGKDTAKVIMESIVYNISSIEE